MLNWKMDDGEGRIPHGTSGSSRTSKTDWPRLKVMKEKDITLTAEHPAAEVKHIVRRIAR
jgi:hypothetical protein